ncbi:MAG: MarR family transcriptional regulator [Corynebacteriales bacterium]|nr:MarR family transcriptional regulator [Mycobacteriales bacterium]
MVVDNSIKLTRHDPFDFVVRLFRAQGSIARRLDQAIGPVHGISFNELLVLAHLERAPGGKLRRVDLAERLGITASGVTRALAPMERLELVRREPDPRDGRIGYAVLTTVGRQRLAAARYGAEEVCRAVLASAPGGDKGLGEFAQLLVRLGGRGLSDWIAPTQ